MTTDDDVVAAAKRGDPDAWRELYRAHASRLVVWLRGRPCGDEGPEDIASGAWLVAAEKVAGFHGTSDEFAGWLFGIARNLSANAHRHAARRERIALDDTAGQPVPGPESGSTDVGWARQLLATLPERERDVVTCREVLDMDVATTATALGISAVAVRVAHHRALKRLRQQVSREKVSESM
ncbi:RNA polymerase sigma-70 factor (ECF subfamily) [Nocardioides sp. J9]|uniref:RNA polymerase sigma factor n=1 Tax=unclassified Nocardioides TaxID=2615069 RepID=UPI00048E6815|nr:MULTISPECIES: sigma-70 family RNA polymerase sigma factor [unclassified Nocardioides]TWG95158.1 RNA polymerase sigma-70 factor (ECF subfamily) [Nocardioides sp. J9]